MADFPYRCALIIGAGPGISASLARRLSKIGLQVGLAARDVEKLKPLAEETAFAVDASQPEQVAKLFLDMERQFECRREGFRPIGGFRDGQVRTARARSERRQRARPEGHTRR